MLQPDNSHKKAASIHQKTTFDQIAENIDDIFWKLDLESQKFTYISPSVEKIRGFSSEEAMKKSLIDSLPPNDYNRINHKIKVLLTRTAGGKEVPRDFKFETQIYNKDKDIIWLEVKASLILDEQNQVVEAIGTSREITLEKNNRLELEKSLEREKFLADILRNSSQAIGLGYNDGKGLFLNQAASDLLGYTEKEASKLNWLSDITPAKWFAQELKILEMCVREKNPVSYKKEYIHKSGKIIPVELLVHPTYNEDGKFLYFIAFINDISEIEQTKKELKATNERFESALKGANDGIWDWDLKTNYQYMSPRYLEMLGYEETEVEYHFNFLKKLLHPDDRERVLTFGEEYESSPDLRTEQTFRLKHKNGHYVSVLSRAYKILDENGKPKRLVGTHTDLSEINSIKDLLKESESKYKYLFDQSNIGIGISTIDGKMLEANKYLLDLMGYSIEDLKGLNLTDVYVNKALRKTFVDDLEKHGMIKDFKLEIIQKSGSTIWISISSKKIIHEGEERFINAISNIDQQIKAEQKLKESEERFKQLSKLTTEGILVHKNGIVLDINDSLLKLVGYTRGEILNQSFDQYCNSLSDRNIKDLLNSSHSLFQIELRSKKGKMIPVEINGRSAYFNGKPAHVTSFIDISSRLETESRINLLSTALEQSAHSVIITDNKGIVEYTNPKFTEITQYEPYEIMGKSVSLLKSGFHDTSFFKDIWESLYKGENWKGEFLRKDKNGKSFWAHSTITPITNKNGKITNFLSVMEDISLQKKNREELEKLNSRLKLTVEAAYFSFWEFKLDTKEAIGDDNIYDFFDLPKESDIKLFDYFKSLFTEKSWNELKQNVLLGLEQKNVIELETKLKIKNKNKIFKSFILRSHESFHKENSILGLTYDITDQKKFESELIEERKRAEESDQLKSSFLANMSHEIRTPLNGIIGFTSLLEEDFSEFSKEEIQKYLKIISENGSYLLSLVNDIIDLSKIESGQLTIVCQEFKLKDIIHQLENRFKTYKQKNVALIFDQSHLDLSLKTDVTRLTQILTNLISNALKFTTEGYVKVRQKKVGKYLEMRIEDTGRGISEEAKSIIFDRFAQGQPLKDQLLGGTGLGLSITKGLVKLLGGDVWFESEEGKGSVFYFRVLINNT